MDRADIDLLRNLNDEVSQHIKQFIEAGERLDGYTDSNLNHFIKGMQEIQMIVVKEYEEAVNRRVYDGETQTQEEHND